MWQILLSHKIINDNFNTDAIGLSLGSSKDNLVSEFFKTSCGHAKMFGITLRVLLKMEPNSIYL